MEFPSPLIPGRLVRRYKRFLSDIELDGGQTVTAHCPNPGSMIGLAEPGMAVWLSKSDNPKRKLAYSWELVAPFGDEAMVSINTNRPNDIVAEALAERRIEEVGEYDKIRREVPYGTRSRIDLLLETDGSSPCYLEVKSVTMKRGRTAAEFPDAVTKRGTKHLGELAAVAQEGARAVMFFLVQRSDCSELTIAGDIDPDYAAAFETAQASGVEALAYSCKITPKTIQLDRRIPIGRGTCE